MAARKTSIVHQWHELKNTYKHLVSCPDKGEEIKHLFQIGQDYIHRHGELMFRAGFLMGAVVTTAVIGILNMVIVG